MQDPEPRLRIERRRLEPAAHNTSLLPTIAPDRPIIELKVAMTPTPVVPAAMAPFEIDRAAMARAGVRPDRDPTHPAHRPRPTDPPVDTTIPGWLDMQPPIHGRAGAGMPAPERAVLFDIHLERRMLAVLVNEARREGLEL